MFKLSPLELRNSYRRRIYLTPLQTFNYRFKDLLDDFESYGLLDDCSTMFKILNRFKYVTRID
jgi:hypothetical protein